MGKKKRKKKKGLDYDDLNSTHELKLENPSKRNGPRSLKGKEGLAYFLLLITYMAQLALLDGQKG